MQSSALGTRGPTPRSIRQGTPGIPWTSTGVRTLIRTTIIIATASVISFGTGRPAAALSSRATVVADASSTTQATGTSWYLALVSSLAASALSAGVTLLTTRSSLARDQRNRRQDRTEAKRQQAALRSEQELRDKRIANRAAWTAHYQRIDDLLVSVAAITYEIRLRRLHTDAPEAAELIRLKKAAEQYAAHAPGRLPTALTSLAAHLEAVHTCLLPTLGELAGSVTPSPHLLPAVLIQAGEQARAADHLTRALKKTQAALRHEWGMQ